MGCDEPPLGPLGPLFCDGTHKRIVQTNVGIQGLRISRQLCNGLICCVDVIPIRVHVAAQLSSIYDFAKNIRKLVQQEDDVGRSRCGCDVLHDFLTFLHRCFSKGL